MMDTVEIVKILKKFKAESAHKYGIKSLGYICHATGI